MATPGGQGVDLWGGLVDILIFVVGGFLALAGGFFLLLLFGYLIKVLIYKARGKTLEVATEEELQAHRRDVWDRFWGRK